MDINIAVNLKRLRRERDLTQDELAGFLGVSFQAVSKWERGDGYPDITFLPVIASYFDITLDELLGMNLIRSAERLKQIHAQWKENNAAGRNAENIALMRDSLKAYPNDYLLMAQLVTSLEKCKAAPGETARNKDEAIKISERIVEFCPDPEIRNAFLFNICHSYWKNGDTDKAIRRAKQLPIIYKTQENALVMFLGGEEKIKVGQQAVIALFSSLYQQITNMTDTDYYSSGDKIKLLQKCISAAELLFEGDDVPIILRHKAAVYIKMADIALGMDDTETAIDCLKSAVGNALRSVEPLPGNRSASLLADYAECEVVSASDFGKLQLHKLLTDKKYDIIRRESRFAELCELINSRV